MSKSSKRFFNEINEMIVKQQYNEEAFNKLLNLVVVSRMLIKQENNEEVKKMLIQVCIVGEELAKKLSVLKDKQSKFVL